MKVLEEGEEGETAQEERERERGEEYSDSGPQGRKEQQQQQPRPRPRGGQRPRRPQTGIFLCSQLKRGRGPRKKNNFRF